MKRRQLLISMSCLPVWAQANTPAALQFPQDHGAHPETRTEWWYLTGHLQSEAQQWGFQVTFFRTATGLGSHPSRFAAQQLISAHAAITDVKGQKLRHDQRMARTGFGVAQVALGDTDVHLRDWSLKRNPSGYQTQVASDNAGFKLNLQLDTTQAVLLQGDAGWSQKGPSSEHHSRYYSQPQLKAQGLLTVDGKALAVNGTAWLDHEWSTSLLSPEAQGWDWIGMNLNNGSALTVFRLRRPDGTALYAGGSFRSASGSLQIFKPNEVQFTPLKEWPSPHSKASYPVQWRIDTPAGSFQVNALVNDQELDSRPSTGGFYWEGLSELRDAQGGVVGQGYLEMTGYGGRMILDSAVDRSFAARKP
jgi:predicted secreted hydrolase